MSGEPKQPRAPSYSEILKSGDVVREPAQPVAPREWNVLEKGITVNGLTTITMAIQRSDTETFQGDTCVHVIEHSAYTALLDEAEALAGALKEANAYASDVVRPHILREGLQERIQPVLERWAAWRGR